MSGGPVPPRPGRRFKSNKLCASDITYLKRLAKVRGQGVGSSSLPVTGRKKCGVTSQLTDPVVCIASPPFRSVSNRLGQCPDFKSEVSGDGVVDNDYEHIHPPVTTRS